jgi:hypothetical protein
MTDDVPKTIILSLLILTILISVIGTWTVMDRLNNVKVQYVKTSPEESVSEGRVKLNVINPDGGDIETSTATGLITLGYEVP